MPTDNNFEEKKFDWEEALFIFRRPLTLLLGGIIMIGLGIIITRTSAFRQSSSVEIIKSNSAVAGDGQQEGITSGEQTCPECNRRSRTMVLEISGSVQNPGVYRLNLDSRVDDLIVAAGGFSGGADREWIQKNINRAAKLIDGQKVYIPSKSERAGEQESISVTGNIGGTYGVSTTGLTNINTASQKELEELPGIGPVYAQSIIEHRMYSDIGELLTKGALKKSVYEKVKDKVTVN